MQNAFLVALAAAEVGISMGTGTDAAMESAGVTLLKGDSMGIVRATVCPKRRCATSRQNLFFAFIYIAAGIRVAVGVIYPTLGLFLSPIFAAGDGAIFSQCCGQCATFENNVPMINDKPDLSNVSASRKWQAAASFAQQKATHSRQRVRPRSADTARSRNCKTHTITVPSA